MNELLIPNVDIPEGKSGDWAIERFTVDQDDPSLAIHNLRCAFNRSERGRFMLPGTYTRLKRNGTIIMSDTPAEKRDHYEPVRKASGIVLINGLGLGMVANACLGKADVEKVIVIEINKDVIQLVAPHWMQKWQSRIAIIHECAFSFQPPRGQRYGMVWHDIWDSICTDNLPQMRKLHRKYGRRTDWQGSWSRSYLY